MIYKLNATIFETPKDMIIRLVSKQLDKNQRNPYFSKAFLLRRPIPE